MTKYLDMHKVPSVIVFSHVATMIHDGTPDCEDRRVDIIIYANTARHDNGRVLKIKENSRNIGVSYSKVGHDEEKNERKKQATPP